MAYQRERPNVEAGDLTVLVIRALGLILGKMVRDDSTVSTIRNVKQFIPTMLVAAPAVAGAIRQNTRFPGRYRGRQGNKKGRTPGAPSPFFTRNSSLVTRHS